ncbi:hypothetical protein T231_12835, partial [Tannerella sp. oral taxon BU063 isolate Cell 6/7/9]
MIIGLIDHREPSDTAMPLRLRRLHHVAVIASDYRRSLQFYTDVLGFTLRAEHYRADRQSYKADLALGDTYVVE